MVLTIQKDGAEETSAVSKTPDSKRGILEISDLNSI
jgi:hypothetical protein